MAKEKFSQMGYISVVESAANTLTFNGLSVFSNVLGQKGMVLHRIEYIPDDGTWQQIDGADDTLIFGMSGVDSLTAVSLDDPEVYDYNLVCGNSYGTPANYRIDRVSVIKDFTNMPGNGLLVPADRLYGFVRGGSLAGASTVRMRFFYTILDLSAPDYLELAQSMRVLK